MAATREPYTEVYEDYPTLEARAKWAGWALITALTDNAKAGTPLDTLDEDDVNKEFYEALYADKGAANIQFIVNGFYLPFGAVIDMMVERFDAEVREAAGQLIRDKGLEIVRSADELNRLIDQYANKVEEELNVRKP